jgi:hypothetical protein
MTHVFSYSFLVIKGFYFFCCYKLLVTAKLIFHTNSFFREYMNAK